MGETSTLMVACANTSPVTATRNLASSALAFPKSPWVPRLPTFNLWMGNSGWSTGLAGEAKCRTRSRRPEISTGLEM